MQRILDSHSGAGVRHRKYNHYLKGVFWCNRCGGRMIFTPGKGNGGTYFYFVCSKRIRGNCQQPYVLAEELERELERYFVRMHIEPEVRETITQAMDNTLCDEQVVEARLRGQIARRLKELDGLKIATSTGSVTRSGRGTSSRPR